MGIVKISVGMHENLRVAAQALSRSINAQAEHWMRMGMLAELRPDLKHPELCRLLIQAEAAGGLDLAALATLALPGPAASRRAAAPRRASVRRAGASA